MPANCRTIGNEKRPVCPVVGCCRAPESTVSPASLCVVFRFQSRCFTVPVLIASAPRMLGHRRWRPRYPSYRQDLVRFRRNESRANRKLSTQRKRSPNSGKGVIALARWENRFPTHNPTHRMHCLVRLPGSLAVPAVLEVVVKPNRARLIKARSVVQVQLDPPFDFS